MKSKIKKIMKQILLSVLIAAMVVPPVYAQDEPASQSKQSSKLLLTILPQKEAKQLRSVSC